ncbi:MAG: NlpC/P60 family protein [Hyphomicrobiaceae bacterium]
MSSSQSTAPDRRIHAWREDLADEALRNMVEARAYTAGEAAGIAVPSAAVRRTPEPGGSLDTVAIHGERVTVFDCRQGWAWVQLARDRYVGYVEEGALGTPPGAATHRVAALATFVYPEADIKSPPLMRLPMASELVIADADERFARLASGGFVVARHLIARDQVVRDFVDVAERFIGMPYLWGGKSCDGLDCSGLVQLSLQMAGFECPRDSDMQEQALGETVLLPDDLEGLERGDLVFWPGHVGIMTDGVMLIHANANQMAVSVEPLVSAARRIAREENPIRTLKRLPGLCVSKVA